MTSNTTTVTDEQIQARLDFADAALNLAGGEVTDPFARDVMRRVAAEEITGDEAAELLHEHFRG